MPQKFEFIPKNILFLLWGNRTKDGKMDGHFSDVVPLLFEKVSSKRTMDDKIMRCTEASHKMDETFQSFRKISVRFYRL